MTKTTIDPIAFKGKSSIYMLIMIIVIMMIIILNNN